MTDAQSIMLAVCFGAVVGILAGELFTIIKYAIEDRKEKKRKEAEHKQ